MRLLRFFGAMVALLGVVALAVVFAPSVFGTRVSAQDRPFDSAQGRPLRDRTMSVLAGRGSGIGVRITDRSEGGVVVDDVSTDSPADKAGLKRSDIIVEFDGERVRSARQFARLVQETAGDETWSWPTTRRDSNRSSMASFSRLP